MEEIVEREKNIVDDKIIEEMNLLYDYNRKTYYRNEIKKSIARLICLIVLFILTLFLVVEEDGFYKIIDIISLIGQIVLMILHAIDIEKDLDRLAAIPELPERLKIATLSARQIRKKFKIKRFK